MAIVWIESEGSVYRCEPQHLVGAGGYLRVFDMDARRYRDLPLVGLRVHGEAPASSAVIEQAEPGNGDEGAAVGSSGGPG